MRRVALLSVPVLLVVISGFVARPAWSDAAHEADVRAMVDATNRAAEAAVANGELDAFLNSYAPNPMVMPQDSPMLTSPEDIRNMWAGLFADNMQNLKLETLTLEIADDFAAEVGRVSFTLHPEGGEPVESKGKYVVLWKPKPDGTWGWYVDCFNSSLPPQ